MSKGSRRVILLGSTGSIGCSTLEVLAHLNAAGRDRWSVVGLAAHSNVQRLLEQAEATGVQHVSLADPVGAAGWTGPGTMHAGPSGQVELVRAVARPGDIVVAAVVGAAGIDAVLAAIECGCDIALANKETLVAAGSIVIPAAAAAGVRILPVDSEHSAVFQCLDGACDPDRIERIVLTASGGPFRGRGRAEIADATVDQALDHPTWTMGRKVTIDSATLANKALEIIEAHWLFGLPAEKIDAIVHPQSFVHGFVEFVDGSVVAQAGPPDMKTPIQCALVWPDRVPGCGGRVDWAQLQGLDFEPIDHETFPLIRLAWDVIRAGGTAGAIFNAANEIAVEAFLGGRIRFGDIFDLVSDTCLGVAPGAINTLDDVRQADQAARAHVHARLTSTTQVT